MLSEKFTCLIADDLMIDRDLLEVYIGKIGTLELVGSCSDGLEAVAILKEKPVDIVFSDIDMPELSGIELIRCLQQPPVFVFISAHPEHAAESYELDIIDFIVKPVTLARLMKAVEKAIAFIDVKKGSAGRTTKAEERGASEFFYIKEGTDHIQVSYAELVCIESMGNFSRFEMLSGKKHMTLVSLKQIEQQLPAPDFLRIHKQHIVNLRHVISVTADGQVNLRNGSILSAGDAYRARLMEQVSKRTLLR